MGFDQARLARMREVMDGYVADGTLPGAVTAVSRGGETHIAAYGNLSIGGEPVRRDTIFRIASMTKPITAAAVMSLVEECVLRLDDPVDDLLPELADRRVLTSPDVPLTDTVPAARSITARDLLTFTFGLGAVPGDVPIAKAMHEAGLSPSPVDPGVTPDEWMRRLGELPLAYQPGDQWLYHTGSDVLGVLIARATGRELADVLRERIFEPLGMRDTGFRTSAESRVPTVYMPDDGVLVPFPAPASEEPAFGSGAGGLLSTADDFLAFYRMLLNGGKHEGPRVLSRASVELLTTDRLVASQKPDPAATLPGNVGWAFGQSVVTRRVGLAGVGQFGWSGGFGTTAFAEPAEDLIAILLTQRALTGGAPHFEDFETTTYQALA